MYLLQTFFSHRIQLLRQRVTKMWLYLVPICLDRSFSEELSMMEINTWIHKVLDHGANQNPTADHAPLRERVTSTRVSLFGPVLVAYAILSSYHARGLAQGLGGAHVAPWGVNFPEDTVRQEVNHDHNEKMQAREERRQA
jgi:hypothetical protein